MPVTQILKDIGITDVAIVPEQEYPNGYFTTCSYPNPEIFAALEQGLKLAKETGADLMLATDPDADRVGIAMKCPDGSYELVSGNEVGVLLLDYIAAGRIEKGTMPKNPVAVKSIVSSPLADQHGSDNGILVTYIRSCKVSVALFKPENETVHFTSSLKLCDLVADPLKSGDFRSSGAGTEACQGDRSRSYACY